MTLVGQVLKACKAQEDPLEDLGFLARLVRKERGEFLGRMEDLVNRVLKDYKDLLV